MLDRKLLTTTFAGRGYFLRHQPISEAKIILEFFSRQLCAIKMMRYSAKPCPIPCCPIEAVFILASCLLLPFKDIAELDGPFAKSRHLAGLMYTCPMAYVVEDGTS